MGIQNDRGRELTLSMLQVDRCKRVALPSAVTHGFFRLGEDLPGHEHGKHHLSAAVVKAHEDRIHNFRLREVILELVESKIAGEHLSYYAQLFDEFDLDHDGCLGREEFAKVWASLDYPAGVKKPSAEVVFKELFASEAVPLVDRLFDEIDSDHSGKIEYSEFAKYLLEMNKPVKDASGIHP